jgi:hypothetical protein
MNLSQFEKAVRHGRGVNGGPAEAGDRSGQIVAAVETILELRKIARNVLFMDGIVGLGQAGFQIAEQGVGFHEGRVFDRLLAGTGDDRLVGAAGIGPFAVRLRNAAG